ncbi:DUF1631 family protein [Rubrivivax rivuli]|uniref:DUF1631 family protein n=1 Tax=Rubrivivax rivuli TaxID=1862385 RepID=A0A437RBX1_9BURK|nr:DUF1631 family protein [Rubrivivax rivuli]RVU44286.1 DUF1631 family protein [Rubrivivax rivuli]
MKPNPIHRLPAPLEAAVQRLKLAAREAAERTIESLGLAALAASNAYQRDGLLGAQFELNRKSAMFALVFNDALDERVLRELGPAATREGGLETRTRGSTHTPSLSGQTDWASLSLVEDKEVEAQISAERFGMDVSAACEWELRELDGYVSAMIGDAGGERDRNPLKPDLVGHAMLRGIETVSDRADVRKVLTTEISRSLGGLLRACYGDILTELRRAGVQPVGLTVRNRTPRAAGGAAFSGTDPGAEAESSRPSGLGGRPDSGQRTGGFGSSTRSGIYPGRGGASPAPRGGMFGHVDPGMMTLIRRLAYVEGPAASGAYVSDYGDVPVDGGEYAQPANLIRAHRDELRGASKGALDHMVIDVIGFLFDQILADPKVPPQMARQIARLQLPVLRAALGDPSFFSSRKHPVRRFINRIASLGAAFEDFGDEGAKQFLAKVKALVHEVVDGDFEQIDVYEQKLAELEAFTAELARQAGPDQAAAALLTEKEEQQRLRQLYAQRLQGELKDVQAPAFLRDFISKVWSQVLLRAAEQGGTDGALAQRLRTVARDLFLSVQPKATPALRKAFLTQLPKLMQDLTEGMNLIGWPEEARRDFFGQLMPAHANALKHAPTSQLDINLMAHEVDRALKRPPPSRDELSASAHLPVLTEEMPQALSSEEAQRVGLVSEAAVNWSGQVDIDLSAEPETPPDNRPLAPGLPAADAEETPQGAALVNHLEIGFAYQMHLDGEWKKVRLSHVSPAKTFYIFSHGGRHRKTISLTQRMLMRLCETGRLKAFESAYLIERATARARRQLSALSSAAPATR